MYWRMASSMSCPVSGFLISAVKIGMPVVAAYEDVEGATLVHFRPA